jgi:hypothetical protein
MGNKTFLLPVEQELPSHFADRLGEVIAVAEKN